MALSLPFPSLVLKLPIVNGNGSDRTLQIKNLIGRMAKNMRAARAARTLE